MLPANTVTVCSCADIIDDIIDHTDVTNTRLIRETQHIKILDRKSGACCKFLLICLVHILHVLSTLWLPNALYILL